MINIRNSKISNISLDTGDHRMNTVKSSLQLYHFDQKKLHSSFDPSIEQNVTKVCLQAEAKSTESSLDSHSTNDEDTLSTVTGISCTASTALTSLGDIPIIPEKEMLQSDNVDPHIRDLHTGPPNDYLRFIHPNPTLPPSYEELPPGGCPKFPVTERISGNEELPAYSPAVFKFGICLRKQEFISPYDLSSNRSWQTVAIELNSTQINVYSVSGQLEKNLWRQNSVSLEELNVKTNDLNSVHCYSSLVTNTRDVELFKICERSGMFDHGLFDLERINDFSQSPPNKSGKHKLIRSYSLQHAKFGLANDYTKKPNVLRLRLENEQVLFHFSSTKELIDWHLAISIGKDVSLDISDREIPKYRTVPRRRRHAIASNLIAWNEIIMRQPRESGPLSQPKSSRHHLSLSGLFKKRLVPMNRSLDHTPECLPNSLAKRLAGRRGFNTVTPMKSITGSETRATTRTQSTEKGSSYTESTSLENEIENEDHNNALLGINSSSQDPSEYNRVSDEFHESEEEYEEYEAESDTENSNTRNLGLTEYVDGLMHVNDYKWDWAHKTESQRRFIRNCIKCIKPLGFDDKWLNKLVVKPTGITPLISHFNMHYPILAVDASSTCSLEANSNNAISSRLSMRTGKYSTRLNDVAKANTALSRIPGHNLQEFIVGTHSLIPKNL